MDRLIYTALSGASQALQRQSVTENNMANADTAGFKKQMSMFRAVPVNDGGTSTRAITAATTPAADFAPGTAQRTGRSLDVAINGPGWLVVQTAGGDQALTRDGNLQRGVGGVLQSGGRPVIGSRGQPITVPRNETVSIAHDGTITVRGAGDSPDALNEVGRLKLVNPGNDNLVRRADGLFERQSLPGTNPGPLRPDDSVRVTSKALESSNVNATEAMVAMIDNSRRFQMHMNAISKAESNAREADKLLSVE